MQLPQWEEREGGQRAGGGQPRYFYASFTVAAAVAVVTYARIRSCQPDALPRLPRPQRPPILLHANMMEINSAANDTAHSGASECEKLSTFFVSLSLFLLVCFSLIFIAFMIFFTLFFYYYFCYFAPLCHVAISFIAACHCCCLM